MSREELVFRLRQQTGNRLDVLRQAIGFNWNWSSSARANTPADGRFFFLAEQIPEIVALLRDNLPTAVADALRHADDIVAHHFRLLGYDSLDYGSSIDWHLDVVHGRHAPRKAGHQVRFLDFSQAGDHKIIWELNRHQHLVTLAKAWAFTHDLKYSDEIVEQWQSWSAANPFPMGINWASSLEVAFRSLSWLWIKALLADCPSVTASFKSDLDFSIALSGRYIERNLSIYFSPNTHLLGEAVALFFIGTLCPQMKAAQRWQRLGWRLIQQEAQRQVRSDGSHFEQSLYYHVYALDFFLHARILASLNSVEVPRSFDLVLQQMLNFLSAVSWGGPPESFGDDDGGRVFDPTRNRVDNLTDPLTIGAALFQRSGIRSAAKLTEEAVWLMGRQAVETFTSEVDECTVKTAGFEAAGIYLLGDSTPYRQRLIIDAGPLGFGRGGHSHADALNLSFSMDGKSWLVDPGTYCYVSEGNRRDDFRGTSAHNTVCIDAADQAESQGPFGWQEHPEVRLERWVVGESFSLFSGSQNGYQRFPSPVLHRRSIFHLGAHFWVIHDNLVGSGHHQADINWHLSSSVTVREVGTHFLCEQSDSGAALVLLPVADETWASQLIRSELSPAYGALEPASLLRLHSQGEFPKAFAMMLLPTARNEHEPGKFTQLEIGGERTHAYCYQDASAEHTLIFANAPTPWSLGPWSSDAEVFYCRTEHEQVAHLIAVQTSRIAFRNSSVLEREEKITRFEWLRKADSGQLFISGETTSGPGHFADVGHLFEVPQHS